MARAADLATACLRRLPPEMAHHASLLLLGAGLGASRQAPPEPCLATRVWDTAFASPIGLAAGFDKDADVLGALSRLGFGFIEVGTVTPEPQPGNPKPRLFRLSEDAALINRMGFNSRGLDHMIRSLERSHTGRAVPVGVNIGVNRDAADPPADYAASLARVAPLADYVVVNVSSPNTPGLRGWQEGAGLDRLLDALGSAKAGLSAAPPLLLKLAPDLADDALGALLARVRGSPIDGLVLTNTTTARPTGLRSAKRDEAGGLSGGPLAPRARAMLRAVYRECGAALPLIAVGGIGSADEAYARIRAGASLIQLYTALVYRGPGLIDEIARGLARRMEADGFTRLADAIGADHRPPVTEARASA